MRHMTCEQYAELNYDCVDDLMQDMFWRDERGNTRKPFEALCRWASDEGVLLTDMQTWDADEYFAGCWACGEWGLS